MRQDMKDLLLETGRNGGSFGKYASSRRAELKRSDPDDLPRFISSSRHRGGGKELGDRLRPLRQFLKKNCGRPWADVYGEICAVADSRTIRGYHLRQHVWQYVVPDRYDIGHRGHYGPFFVDDDGTLQEEREKTEAEREAERRYWQKRNKWKPEPRKVPNPRLVTDADHWWEKIEGFWFVFETKHWTTKNSREDLIEENGEVKIIRIPLRDVHHSATTKRQVDSKTQKKLDATYLNLKKKKAA
jgi:hypothetical protein